jgi:mRNA-degrading endonuclease toxin of MazEF toxin-antitoxin module
LLLPGAKKLGLRPTNFSNLGLLTRMRIVSVLVFGIVVALDGTIRLPPVISPLRVNEAFGLAVAVVSFPTIAVFASVKVLTLVGIEPEAKPVVRTSSSTANNDEPFKFSRVLNVNLVS